MLDSCWLSEGWMIQNPSHDEVIDSLYRFADDGVAGIRAVGEPATDA